MYQGSEVTTCSRWPSATHPSAMLVITVVATALAGLFVTLFANRFAGSTYTLAVSFAVICLPILSVALSEFCRLVIESPARDFRICCCSWAF